MSALDNLLNKSNWSEKVINGITPPPFDEAAAELSALRKRVDILEAHLQFAVNNKENFIEYDPDGIIISWIRSVQVALKGE